MKKTILIICLFSCFQALGQEDITINFDAETQYTNVRARGFRVLYKLEGNNIYFKQDTANYDITLPRNFKAKNPAYGFLRFTGKTENALENYILFLVDDYKSYFPNIYFDYNNNLDFGDDNDASIKFGSDSIAMAAIPNPSVKNAVAQIKLKRLDLDDGDQKNQLEGMLQPKGIHLDKVEATSIDYWYSDEDKNSKIIDVEINNQMVKLGLNDYNGNGLFNDMDEDRVMVGDYEKGFISQRKPEGAHIYQPLMLIPLAGKIYEVTEISPTGDFIKLSESNREFSAGISDGDPLPDTMVKFLGNPSYTVPLTAVLASKKKYVLLDFWGSWCKACTINLPKLKDLAEKHKDNLIVLGLNYGDTPEMAMDFIKNKNVSWPNAVLSKELMEQLKVEGFPSYTLVDPNGKIISLRTTLDKVEELIINN